MKLNHYFCINVAYKLIMDKLTPLFSCVIPTNCRVKLIKELLLSLRAAKLVDNRSLEIILIDDSPRREAEEIQALCKQFDTIYLAGTPSVREKRNLGIKNAHGEYIFFIDSDCQAHKDVFLEHYKTLCNPDFDACIGITDFVGTDSFMWQVISHTKFLDPFRFPSLLKGKVSSAPWGPTTNFSVKRDLLIELGGFETKLPFNLGADDADLGLRINQAGHRIGMSETAIVYHSRETWNGMLKILRRVFRWGRMDYYLFYQRHISRTAFTFPKPVGVFLAFILIQAIISISFSLFLLLPLLLWPVFYLWIFSSITKRHWKIDKTPIRVLMGAEFINQVFDVGCLIMSLRHGSLLFLWREPIDDPRNLWHTKIHTIWASFIACFLLIIIDCIWLVFLLVF